jgi:hypothetical protein
MTDMNDKNSAYASRSRSRSRTRHDTPRHGEASERARVARPSPFTNFTSGPPLVPFKLVKILIGFQCGIESLAFILWTF